MQCSATCIAWTILAFAALNVIFLGGKRRAFGVFVAQLHAEYNNTVSLAELNWIGDSYAAVGYLSTTASSALILYFSRNYRFFQFLGSLFVLLACVTSAYVPNPHWLFVTHTVFHGIGSSLILSCVGLIVNEYFNKQHRHHILATTLVSGGSVASIVFVNVYAELIEDNGWRGAFLILGGIYFVVNSSAVLVFARNPKAVDQVGARSCCAAFTDGSITRRQWPLLVLWTIDRMLTSIVTYGMLMNLADYVMRREHRLTSSAQLTVLFAAGEATTYALGAIGTAVTQDLLRNRLKYILVVATGIMAVALLVWEAYAKHKTLGYVLAYVTGFCIGPSITFLFPAGEEFTTLPGHIAYPFSLGGMGLGMAISPSVTALIAERQNYRNFFSIQGCLMLVKFLVLCISSFYICYNKMEQIDDSPEEYEKLTDSTSDTKGATEITSLQPRENE